MAFKVGRCLLQEILDDKDMTQVELAEKLNVTVQQVNKYVLNKQKMSIQVMKNIAYIVNCQMEDLYEWIEVGE